MHGRLATQSLSFGRILSDNATSRWRGGPRSRHQLTSTLERAWWQIVQALIPHATGEGHIEVAWWGLCMHGSLRRRRLGGGVVVPHILEEKVTSRWRGGPRSRHQLHNSARVTPQTDQASSRSRGPSCTVNSVLFPLFFSANHYFPIYFPICPIGPILPKS
ncbi:hypothetical protein V6N13_127569 [Hibiscus sabdariffa]|uniref:Uncharacterized protein n=1 Tax=Hibiscus sabdariffa TaxID=183260 RepID=A0ABR2CDH9_9ROSI